MTRSATVRLFVALGAALLAAACREVPPTSPTTQLVQLGGGIATVQLEASEGVAAIAPGRIVVRYREGVDHQTVEDAYGVQHLADLQLPRGEILAVPVGTETAMATTLANDSNVEFAQTDNVMVLQPCEVGNCEQPTDGFFPRKWDLHNDGTVRASLAAPTLLALTAKVDADIDWLEMFDFLGPAFTEEAKVGIVDTGIRDTHQDITGKVIAAQNFAFLYPSTLIADRVGHGSHVSGIVAARGQNGVGVMGLGYGPNIKLINAKACELYNVGGVIQTLCFESSVANAITYAADQGAKVINLSLGGSAPSALQQAALQYAIGKGALPVCATGNNNASSISFPARFSECFAVGSTDWGDNRASYSNYGPEIDVVAPGGDTENQPHSLILSLSISGDNVYAFNAGTSMATPQVTGLAAVLFAKGIATTPAAIADRIRNTADDLGPAGFDNETGFGRINAYRAVTGLSPDAPPLSVNGGPYAAITEGGSVAFNGSGSNDPNGKPITYEWNFGDGSSSNAASPSHTYVDNGSYNVTLKVTDQSGRSATTGTTVTVSNAAPVVQVALSRNSIFSGESIDLNGGFSDVGVADAPWTWAIDWRNGTVGGNTADQSAAITGSRRYCAAGAYDVGLSVTDKDASTGSASAALTVLRLGIGIVIPSTYNTTANGRVPVHILSSSSFDATTLDMATLTIGNGTIQVPVALQTNGAVHAAIEDWNGDGLPDLTAHFDRPTITESGALPPSGIAGLVVHGTALDGCLQYRGAANTRIVK